MKYEHKKPPVERLPVRIGLIGGETVEGTADIVTTDLRRVEFLLNAEGKIPVESSLGRFLIDPAKMILAEATYKGKLYIGMDYKK